MRVDEDESGRGEGDEKEDSVKEGDGKGDVEPED